MARNYRPPILPTLSFSHPASSTDPLNSPRMPQYFLIFSKWGMNPLIHFEGSGGLWGLRRDYGA